MRPFSFSPFSSLSLARRSWNVSKAIIGALPLTHRGGVDGAKETRHASISPLGRGYWLVMSRRAAQGTFRAVPSLVRVARVVGAERYAEVP